MGFENLKLQLTKNNKIVVDDRFQTANKNVFAIGDIIDQKELTPVAIR